MAYLDSIMPGGQVSRVAAMGSAVKEYNDRDDRIAELEAELEEVRKQRKSLDTEADMGKYKFLYDADPGTYTNVMMQKATQKKTDTQQKMDAWKQSSIAMEDARYKVAYWQQKKKEALDAQDTDRYNEAKIELSRAEAGYRRAMRDNDVLRKQVGSQFGFTDDEFVEPKNQGTKVATKQVVSEQQDDLEQDEDPNVAQMEAFNRLKKEINDIDLNFDNEPVDIENERNPRAEQARAMLNDIRKQIEENVSVEAGKDKLLEDVRKKEQELEKYLKPAKYGGPKRKLKPGDWKKATTGKTKKQLETMDTEFLKQAWRDGNHEPNLKAVLIIKGVNPDIL